MNDRQKTRESDVDSQALSPPDYTKPKCVIKDAEVSGKGPYELRYTCSCGGVTTVRIRLLESGDVPELDFADGKFSDDPHEINCWNVGVLWTRVGQAGLNTFLEAVRGGAEWEAAFSAALNDHSVKVIDRMGGKDD